jgi:hypothetical protein
LKRLKDEINKKDAPSIQTTSRQWHESKTQRTGIMVFSPANAGSQFDFPRSGKRFIKLENFGWIKASMVFAWMLPNISTRMIASMIPKILGRIRAR